LFRGQVVRKLQMTERELERMEERAEAAELYVCLLSVLLIY